MPLAANYQNANIGQGLFSIARAFDSGPGGYGVTEREIPVRMTRVQGGDISAAHLDHLSQMERLRLNGSGSQPKERTQTTYLQEGEFLVLPISLVGTTTSACRVLETPQDEAGYRRELTADMKSLVLSLRSVFTPEDLYPNGVPGTYPLPANAVLDQAATTSLRIARTSACWARGITRPVNVAHLSVQPSNHLDPSLDNSPVGVIYVSLRSRSVEEQVLQPGDGWPNARSPDYGGTIPVYLPETEAKDNPDTVDKYGALDDNGNPGRPRPGNFAIAQGGPLRQRHGVYVPLIGSFEVLPDANGVVTWARVMELGLKQRRRLFKAICMKVTEEIHAAESVEDWGSLAMAGMWEAYHVQLQRLFRMHAVPYDDTVYTTWPPLRKLKYRLSHRTMASIAAHNFESLGDFADATKKAGMAWIRAIAVSMGFTPRFAQRAPDDGFGQEICLVDGYPTTGQIEATKSPNDISPWLAAPSVILDVLKIMTASYYVTAKTEHHYKQSEGGHYNALYKNSMDFCKPTEGCRNWMISETKELMLFLWRTGLHSFLIQRLRVLLMQLRMYLSEPAELRLDPMKGVFPSPIASFLFVQAGLKELHLVARSEQAIEKIVAQQEIMTGILNSHRVPLLKYSPNHRLYGFAEQETLNPNEQLAFEAVRKATESQIAAVATAIFHYGEASASGIGKAMGLKRICRESATLVRINVNALRAEMERLEEMSFDTIIAGEHAFIQQQQ